MDSLKKITPLIDNEINQFEKSLKNLIEIQDNFLKNDLIDFIFNKPKRLRVVFIFLIAKILKLENPLVNSIALIVELFHSASLIHDDIIDNSTVRRNLATLHTKYNSKIAVLEGDILLTLALSELSKTNLEIVKICSDKIKSTLEGELKQNEDINKIEDIDTYLKRTFDKTANLFLMGILCLFTLKEIDEKIKTSLINFVKNFSIAFQIRNDIKNIEIDNSDFTNGNYTLPVIYFFMENENKLPNKENLAKYIELANKKIDEFINKAKSELINIENSEYKKALILLSDDISRS